MEDNSLEQMEILRTECDQMGREFVRQLRNRTGRYNATGIPIAVAAILDELIHYNQVDLNCFYLKESFAKLIGMRLERYAPGIEALYARLNQIGATSNEKKVNNGGDNYIYCLPSNSYWRYALACETQNKKFLVLMRYGSKGEYLPEKIKARFERLTPVPDEKELEGLLEFYRPQIYICQYPWKQSFNILKKHSQLPTESLPDWTDDRNPDGYVAFLKEGEVKGAIHHYTKIANCLYHLASFIEFRDDLELD